MGKKARLEVPMSDIYLEKLNELLSEMYKEYQIVRKSVNRPVWPQLMIINDRGRIDHIAIDYKNGSNRK